MIASGNDTHAHTQTHTHTQAIYNTFPVPFLAWGLVPWREVKAVVEGSGVWRKGGGEGDWTASESPLPVVREPSRNSLTQFWYKVQQNKPTSDCTSYGSCLLRLSISSAYSQWKPCIGQSQHIPSTFRGEGVPFPVVRGLVPTREEFFGFSSLEVAAFRPPISSGNRW